MDLVSLTEQWKVIERSRNLSLTYEAKSFFCFWVLSLHILFGDTIEKCSCFKRIFLLITHTCTALALFCFQVRAKFVSLVENGLVKQLSTYSPCSASCVCKAWLCHLLALWLRKLPNFWISVSSTVGWGHSVSPQMSLQGIGEMALVKLQAEPLSCKLAVVLVQGTVPKVSI